MPRGAYDISAEEEHAIYERGIALFNARKFFEAHETWEDAWNGTSGRRSVFYQGLIQMAVTLVHLERGNRLGVVKVFERALAKWAGLPDVYLGLDLREFEALMRHLLEDVLSSEPGTPVRFDASRFFAIEVDWERDER